MTDARHGDVSRLSLQIRTTKESWRRLSPFFILALWGQGVHKASSPGGMRGGRLGCVAFDLRKPFCSEVAPENPEQRCRRHSEQ